MDILELSSNNFEKEVLENDKPVLVDFWASWCGPCRAFAPIIDEIAEELGDSIKICKVNIDDEPDLAAKFEVASIPTLIVFRDGQPLKRSTGLKSKEDVLDMIK